MLTEQRSKKRGDRFDGCRFRDEVPALGQFMAYLMPNRADNEAHIIVDILFSLDRKGKAAYRRLEEEEEAKRKAEAQ